MSNKLFDFIKNNINIADLIGSYVRLKPAGRYLKGSCPFHQETDASFTVSPDKQIFYCFGCQAGGDVVAFTAKAESLSQIEAVNYLVEQYNITVPEAIKNSKIDGGKSHDEKQKYHKVLSFIARWAHEQLTRSERAKKYISERGISQESIDYFSIGYFPGGVKFIQHIIQQAQAEQILLKDLLETQAFFESKTGIRSPFENRIIFPIYNQLGRCCGFGGRVFLPNDDRAKYYNSKESEYFIKGRLLFGFDKAKQAMQESKQAFLVEGYTDTVAMVQNGYKNTVATLGTACTIEHLQSLSRFVETLYILFDGDGAGQKAILRLASLCWAVNIELKVLVLPKGEDPAVYLGREKNLAQLISHAPDIFSFFVNKLGEDFFRKTLAEKMRLMHKLLDVLNTIDDPIKKDILLQQASAVFQVSFDALKKQSGRVAYEQAKKEAYREQYADKEDAPEEKNISTKNKIFPDISEREIPVIALYINNREKEITESSGNLQNDLPLYLSVSGKKIVESYNKARNDLGGNQGAFEACLQDFSLEEQNWLREISIKYDINSEQGEQYTERYEQVLFRFLQENWKHVVQRIRTALLDARQRNDQESVKQLLNDFAQVKQNMHKKGLL